MTLLSQIYLTQPHVCLVKSIIPINQIPSTASLDAPAVFFTQCAVDLDSPVSRVRDVTVVLKPVWWNIITPLSWRCMSNIRACLMSDTRRPYIKPVHDVRLMSNIYVCISGVGMDQHKIGWTHFFFLLSEKKKRTSRRTNFILSVLAVTNSAS